MTSIIDDQDLSKVVYNGTWVKGGSVNEYDETVASSTTVGDSFTVTFKGKHLFTTHFAMKTLSTIHLQVLLLPCMAPLTQPREEL